MNLPAKPHRAALRPVETLGGRVGTPANPARLHARAEAKSLSRRAIPAGVKTRAGARAIRNEGGV
jgi:hypothetical protein